MLQVVTKSKMVFNKSSRSLVFITIPLLLISQLSNSLDLEGAKEMACFEIPSANLASPDLDWMLSVKQWYYVMVSRLELYRVCLHLTQKSPNDLHENTVYDSCISWKMNPADLSFMATGLGKQMRYTSKPLQDNFAKFGFISDAGTHFSGTCNIPLTDNSTFLMYVCCMEDMNQMTWGIGSPYKSLKKETMNLIHDHLESFGFKREHFTGLSYECCDKNNQDGPDKNEL